LNPLAKPAATAAPAVAESPVTTNGTASNNPETISEIEALLAFAIAQQLINNGTIFNASQSPLESLAVSSSSPIVPSVSVVSKDIPEKPVGNTLDTLVEAPTPTQGFDPASLFAAIDADAPTQVSGQNKPMDSIPELFTSTFKYTEGQSITSNTLVLEAEDEVSVYAPAFAPNYGVRMTTQPPVYAPAYDHNTFTTPAPSTKPPPPSSTKVQILTESSTEAKNTATEEASSPSEAETIAATTDEYDYDAAAITTSNVATNTTETDEDGDEYDENGRSIFSR
jgi:hypothetical protein